jgi:AraC-like DNA-binding protein
MAAHEQSRDPISVSVSVLKQMLLYLASLNIDADSFLRSTGIDPQIVKSPDGYMAFDTYLHIEEEAARCANDPYFGLHMGQYAEPGSWSILGYLMMNCANLGEAFEKSSRYQRIVGNLISGRASLKFNKIRVVLETPSYAPKMSRHCFESALSSSVRIMRTLTGKQIGPRLVTFSYPEPVSTDEYVRIFGCPVLFDQKETSMTLDFELLRTPVLLPNLELQAYFEDYAQNILTEMENKEATTQRVTKIILARLDDEDLTINKVAKEMAVSVRTLQKRLKDEGVVFSDLLMDIRKRLAKKYLHERYSVEDITYLLGYSEPSVFRKAFKKWSGITPREFRERSFSGMSGM